MKPWHIFAVTALSFIGLFSSLQFVLDTFNGDHFEEAKALLMESTTVQSESLQSIAKTFSSRETFSRSDIRFLDRVLTMAKVHSDEFQIENAYKTFMEKEAQRENNWMWGMCAVFGVIMVGVIALIVHVITEKIRDMIAELKWRMNRNNRSIG